MRKWRIRKRLKYIFKELDLKNKVGNYPTIRKIHIDDYGFKTEIVISGICSYIEFENHIDYINTCFKAYETNVRYNQHAIELTVITTPVQNLNYEYIKLPPYKLLFGFTRTGQPIISNMLKTPHVGVVGTSNSGKSKCVECALMNVRGAKFTFLNCFQDDFTSVEGERINQIDKIRTFLQSALKLEQPSEIPHYIVIDEYNVLSNHKGMDKLIQDLLSQARHFNIYVICIMQIGNKEDCKFKNLFNTRIAFRTLEQQTINAFLGTNMRDTFLRERQFYMVSTEIFFGKSYNITC